MDGKPFDETECFVFKLVDTSNSQEAAIFRYLQQGDPGIAAHPANHTIPIIDILELSPSRSIIVMEEWTRDYTFVFLETLEEYEELCGVLLEVRTYV